MKIGIIVYSYSGNTLSVAEQLQKTLEKSQHKVKVEKVAVIDDNPESDKPIEFENMPIIADYDFVIFASPVRAFSLAKPMKLYLEQLPETSKKKAYCFVTQHFKRPWLGGNLAVRQIKSICKTKGITIEKTGIVNWSSDKKEQQIENLVNTMGGLK